jgi:hypothetical protein
VQLYRARNTFEQWDSAAPRSYALFDLQSDTGA